VSATVNLRIRIAERVCKGVISGDFAPGARINEVQLSKQLGVSRTPLREALLSIERLGIIEADPQRGFVVATLSAREVRELYAIGRTLDALALRSAGPVPVAVIDTLQAANERFRAARENGEAARVADREFHELLTARNPNRRLHDMLAGVQTAMERYERLYMSDALAIDRSAKQHDRVIAALRRDDLEDAIRTFEEQWDDSVRHLLHALGELP
jgi:DNA-binding GntR family transcriptional regulator